jgi:hypothetical protein
MSRLKEHLLGGTVNGGLTKAAHGLGRLQTAFTTRAEREAVSAALTEPGHPFGPGGRLLTGTVLAEAWPTPTEGQLERLKADADRLARQIPKRIEYGEGGDRILREHVDQQNASIGGSSDATRGDKVPTIMGLPLVLNPDLPDGVFEAVFADGRRERWRS